MDLHNETAINVAALLKEQVGASRAYPVVLDRFQLDSELVATDVVDVRAAASVTAPESKSWTSVHDSAIRSRA